MTNSLSTILNQKIKTAFTAANIPAEHHDLAVVNVSGRPELADYQCNAAMGLTKKLNQPPLKIAENIVTELQNDSDFAEVSIAKPGFINMRLSPEFLSAFLSTMQKDNRFTCPQTTTPKNVVLDYGGPNMAKEMHVGHLRSAIIGESIKRIGKFIGHNIIGDVHLGDWGTPIGMLIEQLKIEQPNLPYFNETQKTYPDQSPVTLEELSALYKRAAQRNTPKPEDDDATKQQKEQNRQQSRITTNLLQEGHAGYRALWQHFWNVSVDDIKRQYALLNVEFDLWLGESHAQPHLKPLLEQMQKNGVAKKDQGAIIIPIPPENGKEFPPLIYEKSDGGYTYGATDLATIHMRMTDQKADEIIYIVDNRQRDHFKQVFAAARAGGIVKPETNLEHVGFGTVNGPDGKPFKTRSGDIVRLTDLIETATSQAKENLPEPGTDGATEKTINNLASMIGVAAIKFYDLINDPTSNYIFDMNNFVKFEGKTGPYLQYAIARINSMLEKANDQKTGDQITLTEEAEKKLALILCQLPTAIENAYEKRKPSILCEHAFNLAQAFSSFYSACPVLTAETPTQQTSRLNLSKLTRNQLVLMLNLLGIQSPDRMQTRKRVEAA